MRNEEVKPTMVETWHTNNKQAIVHKYKHMSGRNDGWIMWLKTIQVKYYSIENQKSYSSKM